MVVRERREGIVGYLDFTKVPLMTTLGAFETGGISRELSRSGMGWFGARGRRKRPNDG
jgi:hypothetical protein